MIITLGLIFMILQSSAVQNYSVSSDRAIVLSEYDVPYVVGKVENYSNDTLRLYSHSCIIEKIDDSSIKYLDTLSDLEFTSSMLNIVAPKSRVYFMQDLTGFGFSRFWDEAIARPLFPTGSYRLVVRYAVCRSEISLCDEMEYVDVEFSLKIQSADVETKAAVANMSNWFASRIRANLASVYRSHINSVPVTAMEYFLLSMRCSWLASKRDDEYANFMRVVGTDAVYRIPDSYAAVFFSKILGITENAEKKNSKWQKDKELRNKYIDKLKNRSILRLIRDNHQLH